MVRRRPPCHVTVDRCSIILTPLKANTTPACRGSTRRRIDDWAFSVAAPRAWNTLPTQLKLLRSTTTYSRQLTTFCSSLPTDTGKQTDDCFLVHPRSPSKGRNTNDCYCSHSLLPLLTSIMQTVTATDRYAHNDCDVDEQCRRQDRQRWQRHAD